MIKPDMKKIYIARKYVAIEGGARHFYEEAVFDSYDIAYKFIKNISEEDEDYFLSEIVCYVLNKFLCDEDIERYIFDKQGALIWKNNSHKIERLADSFTGKFSIGDVVHLSPFPWNAASPTHVETLGVVARVPVAIDEWIGAGHCSVSWDDSYIVEHIRNGYLGHWHVREKVIDLYCDILPENLSFLKVLADHYLERKNIPEKIFRDIQEGIMFIEKVKHF